MSIDDFLSRLNGVTKSGPGKWRACCPAHQDRSPSLSLLLLDDGRILIHCFSGCPPGSVLGALGLEFADLYPSPASFHLPVKKKPWNAYDVLCCLLNEVLVAWIIASDFANNQTISENERKRLLLCVTRLFRGLEVVNG